MRRRRWTTIVTLVAALGVLAATSPEEEPPIAGEAAVRGLEVVAGSPGVEADVVLGLDPTSDWFRVEGRFALEGIVGTSVVEVQSADGAIRAAGAVAESAELDLAVDLRCDEVDCQAPLTIRVRPAVAGTEVLVAGRLMVETFSESSTEPDPAPAVAEPQVVDAGPLTWSTLTIDPDHPVTGQRVEVPDAACAEGTTWVVVAPHTPGPGEGPIDDPAATPMLRVIDDGEDRPVPTGGAVPLRCGDDGVVSAWVVLADPVAEVVTADWTLVGAAGTALVEPSTVTAVATETVAVGAELRPLAPVAVALGRAGLVLADPVADDDPDDDIRVGSADPSLGGQGPTAHPGYPEATFGSRFVAPVLWPCEGSCPSAVELWLRRPDADDVVDAHAVVYALAVG